MANCTSPYAHMRGLTASQIGHLHSFDCVSHSSLVKPLPPGGLPAGHRSSKNPLSLDGEMLPGSRLYVQGQMVPQPGPPGESGSVA